MAKLKLLFCNMFDDEQVREVCPTWQPDSYLEDYDPEVGFLNTLRCTQDPDLAMEFDSAAEAMDFWNGICPTAPVRPDGKPNRPLTIFTVTVE